MNVCFSPSTGNEIAGKVLSQARPHSGITRQIVLDLTADFNEQLKAHEEKIEALHKLLTGKNDTEAIEARFQEIETTVKQLKVLFENGVKPIEVEATERVGKEHDPIEESFEEDYELSEEVFDDNVILSNDSQENVSLPGKFAVYVFLPTLSLDGTQLQINSKCQ